jgi:phage-related protein
MMDNERSLTFISTAREDLRAFPKPVREVVGQALYAAQLGDKHRRAKPLAGFGGAGVLEIVDDFDGDSYRAVYTVRLRHAVYVLHCFQKKSTRGVATTQRDLDRIRQRLRMAEELDALRGRRL